jgi:hypothetical protein
MVSAPSTGELTCDLSQITLPPAEVNTDLAIWKYFLKTINATVCAILLFGKSPKQKRFFIHVHNCQVITIFLLTNEYGFKVLEVTFDLRVKKSSPLCCCHPKLLPERHFCVIGLQISFPTTPAPPPQIYTFGCTTDWMGDHLGI